MAARAGEAVERRASPTRTVPTVIHAPRRPHPVKAIHLGMGTGIFTAIGASRALYGGAGLFKT